MRAGANAMGKTERQRTVFVVYPAALFDGWEVVKDGDEPSMFFDAREDAISYAESRAAMEGGALVKLENWFGDEQVAWEVVASPKEHLLIRLLRLLRKTRSSSRESNHAA